MPPIARPKGTNDLLPPQTSSWEWLLATHAQVARDHGYRLIETPIFEFTEMFERGIGAGTDVVDKEMYSFVDKGGDSLTLRPEGTPATVRAVLSAHLEQELRPVRVHYAGQMFRRDRPQKGRYRQFHQVGIEAIAERSAALDVEVIEIGWRFFAALGVQGVSLQLNTLGDINDRSRYRKELIAYYQPRIEQLCDDCRRRLEINPLRLLDCKRDASLVAGAPFLQDSLSDESRLYFEDVLAGLRAADILFEVNQRLVRGLDYYAHTTFEWWHTSLQGAQNALGGGGRYDGLAEVLGFPSTPGVGYALGCERILIIAEELGAIPPTPPMCDVVVCALDPETVMHSAAVARVLRAGGVQTVLDASSRKLDKKLRDAERQGAEVVAIVGPEEVKEHNVALRHLPSRRQQVVGLDNLHLAVDSIRKEPS